MIKKIKELMQIKELIDSINKRLEEHTNSIETLKNESAALNDSLEKIKDKQEEFLNNFNQDLNIIRESREALKKELYDFKIIRSQLQKKIIEKFEEELSKKLNLYSEKLDSDTEEYKKTKESIAKITERLANFSEEINKFLEISKKIKKEDFELTRYAKKIMEADREKLELMKKIDTLERLIAKMRRQGK